MKKYLILLLGLILTTLNIYAEVEDRGGHAGTPAGFYDDIDPATLENDNKQIESHPRINLEDNENHGFYNNQDDEDDDLGIIMPATSQTKATKNYAEIYNNLEVPTFSYLHDIDPDQYYDTKDATWSIYPLFRLNSPLYFKSITIEPGYYLITPREHKGEWYILFKQNGVVKHIIPTFEKNYTPEHFYDEHIPKPKYTPTQKIHMGILDFVGHFKSSKRKAPIKSYLEVNDLENYFVSIIIYYGNYKYSTIFRTIKL